MKKLLEKLYINDKLFYAAPLIYLVSAIIFDIAYGIDSSVVDMLIQLVTDLISFGVIAGVVISFKQHEKNVMKTLMGGALFTFTMNAVSYSTYFGLVDTSDAIYSVFCIVWGLLVVALLVSHFVLAQDHKSQPWLVSFNQYLVVVIFIFALVWELYYHFTADYSLICALTYGVCIFIKLFTVVAVEYRVDLFKQIRQEKAENK